MTTCVACKAKLHPHAYHNEESGVLLCQDCTHKVAVHYIDGLVALTEVDARMAHTAQMLLKHVPRLMEKKE